MKQSTPIRACVTAFVLCLLASAAASADEDFRHPLCLTDDNGALSSIPLGAPHEPLAAKKCIVLEVTWSFSGSEDAAFDRISAQFDGVSCEVARQDGSARIVDGNVPYKVDAGTASLTRRWLLPAGCPMRVHGHSKIGDRVRTFRFDAAETQNDISSAFDWAP